MTKFELCAECQETFLERYAYDADGVEAKISTLKTQIKKLREENKRLKKEAADYHQLQWQHDALIDENEKLKRELKQMEVQDQVVYEEQHKEIRKMNHSIWFSRACRAKLEIRYWQSNNRNFFGYRFNVRHEITDEGHYADYWIRLWQRIENLCLEKAKEFE